MTIPESREWDKGADPGAGKSDRTSRRPIFDISQTPVFLAIILLTGTLCLGLGLLVQKQNTAPKDGLWIEQLPASVLSGSAGTSTWGSQSTDASLPSKPQEDDPETVAAKPSSIHSSQSAAAAAALSPNGTYVASKTGTKYYLPSCGTAKRIKDSNKVWFMTKTEAEAAGYQPAANCKGL